jgi:hypothetical protein
LSNYQNLLNLAVADYITERRRNFERMECNLSTWGVIMINKKMNLESPKLLLKNQHKIIWIY